MAYTDTIKAKSHLKDLQDDISYAISEEDSEITISDGDLKHLAFIKQTIESLENDYERLHDKIVIAIYRRIDEIGKENANSDFVVQLLQEILKSEQNN